MSLSFDEETAALEGFMFTEAERIIVQAVSILQASDPEWCRDARGWLKDLRDLRKRWRSGPNGSV